MGLRKIITDNDPVLRKKTREVTEFDERLHRLLDDMWETLHEAHGAGLAAPQVGILRRVAIVEAAEGRSWELVNPEIVSMEGEAEEAEGCLSFPGVWGIVSRPTKVIVKAKDRYGKSIMIAGHDFEARAFCHEIDHLSGNVFTDKVIRYVTLEELREMEEAKASLAEKEDTEPEE